MNDSEYMDRAEALLKAVETGCDRINDETDADLDNQRVGGMVTITFANRSQIVINQQKPLHEIWMATKATHGTSIFMACAIRVAWGVPLDEGICRGRPAKIGKNGGAVFGED